MVKNTIKITDEDREMFKYFHNGVVPSEIDWNFIMPVYIKCHGVVNDIFRKIKYGSTRKELSVIYGDMWISQSSMSLEKIYDGTSKFIRWYLKNIVNKNNKKERELLKKSDMIYLSDALKNLNMTYEDYNDDDKRKLIIQEVYKIKNEQYV